MRSPVRTVTSATLGALWLLGCTDPLEAGQVIDRTRALAARVEVDGAPDRAWPAPGETASVRWLVAGPNGAPALTYRLWACVPEVGRNELPPCAGRPIAAAEQTEPVLEPPSITFSVPPAEHFGASASLAVFGIFCEGGTASVDGSVEDARCSPGATRTLRVSAAVPIQFGERTNHHPDLSGDRIELDGEPWRDTAGCAEDAPRFSIAQGARTVSILFDTDDREPLAPDESPVGDPRETLQLSHLSTVGELDRPFSFVEARDESNPPRIDVDWTPPGTVSADGGVAHFVFVLRDGRGGVDWQTRELCLVP